jgi:transcription-repair coupling factor (superfamily II helicase)
VLGQSENNTKLSQHPLSAKFSGVPHFAGQISPVIQYLSEKQKAENSQKDRSSVIVVLSRQAARLAEVWSEHNSPLSATTELPDAPSPGIYFVTGALSGGFHVALNSIMPMPGLRSLTLLTDAELFGQVRLEPSVYSRPRRAAPERAFADWSPGDVVVHEDYGIGVFRGLTKLTVNDAPVIGAKVSETSGIEREYLLLEFADADRLYVPLHQLDRISRYIGNDDARPVLSKLHSGEWEVARRKAKGAAAETAREMLTLYAERELAEGFEFSTDTQWQQELELSFPFIETEDQMKAINAVKVDMQRKKPMDRLICGDVGFGKTEVALRAAFKAVQDGKQVAVLVPTTVLAQQHWNTFSRRLATFPIKVEMISRFRTPAEKRKIIENLANGAIDIVIGTHSLVAEGVKFKDLGLLVIDEEQRFGIKDKEKLKKLRTGVDVLTLTATPIPRTLYMGLSGMRDITRIETPPAERLPIISHIGPHDDHVMQQAIRRELDRDGQVFFVHNRVQTIDLMHQKLERLVPEARIAVAHGQMEEKRLASVMNQFSDGRTDILLCTNIIESGLDIPNANTIIIDQAQMFGLSELYQLRGRVGRSTTQAYAYFLHDRRSQMTEDARERLQTMREAAGMGAGYMVAMRDLELRGAGDMLGPKQSGQVASVGLDLYSRLLAREVTVLRALRDGASLPEPEAKPITIDLPLAVGLPESYIPDNALRVQMYRRVASLDSETKIQTFEEELEDRFGKMPPAARNLTYQAKLKLYAERFGTQSITSEGNRLTLRADAIEGMNADVLRLKLGEGGLLGRKQWSMLRSGTAEQWKTRLMEVVLWMAGQSK